MHKFGNSYVYDPNWDGSEVWRVTVDDVEFDFYESSQTRAEDYLLQELMLNGGDRAEALRCAADLGYKVERIFPAAGSEALK